MRQPMDEQEEKGKEGRRGKMAQTMDMNEEDSREDARTLMEQGLEHEHEHDVDGRAQLHQEHRQRKLGRAHVTSVGSGSGSSVDSGPISSRRDAYSSGSMRSAANSKDLGLSHGTKLQQDSKRTPAPAPISRLRPRPRPHPSHPQSQSQSHSPSQSQSQSQPQSLSELHDHRDRDSDDSKTNSYHHHNYNHNHNHNHSSNLDHYDPYSYPYPYPSASASATNLTAYPRINSSSSPWIEDYTASPETPSAPTSPLSLQWDYLTHSTSTSHHHVAASTPNSPLAHSFYSSQPRPDDGGDGDGGEGEDDGLHLDADSIASETRDEFPPLPTSKLNHSDGHTLIENFSRPRNLSIKQSYLESPRFRPLNQLPLESSQHDGVGHPLESWPRSRGPSVSSNKSAATFASLPVRPPPDIYPRESPRSRGRQPHPPPTRLPVSYSRAESSGPPYIRDAIPRMASLPTEELRSSYRSQLSASTAQGTLGTERSSVLTKSSSLTSVDGPIDTIDPIDDIELIEDDEDLIDDDFSLSDIMGMYERGFGDDSAPEDNNEFEDSRPPTATSELNRRSMAMLLAISNSATASKPPAPTPSSNPNMRHSIAIRRGSAPTPSADVANGRLSRIVTDMIDAGAASDGRDAEDVQDTEDDKRARDTSEVGDVADNNGAKITDAIKIEDSVDITGEEEPENIKDMESITEIKDVKDIDGSEISEDVWDNKEVDNVGDIRDLDEDVEDGDAQNTRAVEDTEDAGEAGDVESAADSVGIMRIDADDDGDKGDNTSTAVAADDIEPRRPTRQQTNLTTTDDDGRDRYGFRKANQYITREQYDTWNEGYTEYLDRRRRKWVAFLKENGLMTDTPNRFPPRSTKAKRFVRKGIPPDWRGAAWFYYAGGPAILAKHAGLYDELLKRRAKDVDIEAVERDLHRTFPDNIKFRSSNPDLAPGSVAAARNSQQILRETLAGAQRPDETPMISSLRRVLHAFSVYNPRIGYCQSLNFLAGLLLLFVESEEHAFWLLNIITRVYLPGTHEMSLEGANVDLGVLMTSLRESMPAVWAKIGGELDGTDSIRPRHHRRLKQRGEQIRLPPITLCMTAWFMSCFIGTLPIETTLRVWDVFFYEGSKTLFRIALAIFKLGEAEIRSVGDPMEIFQVVQTIPRKIINANGLMEACFKRRNGFGHLSQETIEQKRQERRNYVKAEKEKMALGDKVVTADIEATRKGTLFSRRRGS